MRKLSNLMSPTSWVVIGTLLIPSWLLLFSPTWTQLAWVILIDFLVFLPFYWINRRWLLKRVPAARLFYDGLNWPALEKMTDSEQDAFLEQLCAFPAARMRLFTFATILRMTPVIVLMLFWWPSPHGFVWHACMIIFFVAVTRLYGASAVFIDCSLTVARYREEIKSRLNWTRAFSRERMVCPSEGLDRVEALVTGLLLFTYMAMAYIGLRQQGADYSIYKLGFHFFAGTVLIIRFQYLTRTYRGIFMKGVVARLEEKERELSTWVFDQSERQRFRTFGEVAGLVVHDLANPIHTVAFCAEALSENPHSPKRDNYLEIILKNCEKVSSLIRSLRTYLKRGDSAGQARLLAVHQNALDIIGIQYSTKNLQRVKFEWDPNLDDVRVKAASNEVIHILLNLYSNSIKDFLEHENEAPRIRTALHGRANGFVTIEVADNGSALSPEGFHTLVTSGFIVTPQGRKEGLGIRLGCRLIEQHGGAVLLDERYFQEGRGTRLLLKLPEIISAAT